MKKHTIPAIILALVTILAFASCDAITNFIASRTRNISVIQVFNSSREETRYFMPNDTLYVQVSGLAADGIYQVDCVDPDGNVITTMVAQADADGVIAPNPIWYDVGFKKVFNDTLNRYVAVLPTSTELGLNAFNIRVHDAADTEAATDFKLPFFVLFNTNMKRPKPIVMAGRLDGTQFVVENSFKAGDGLYVQTANLDELPTPAPASGKVMIYIVPFDGGYYKEGDSINNFVVKQEATVAELQDGIKIAANSEVWVGGASWSAGIPAYAKGRAFSVILDVNEDGVFQERKEGTTDYYLDGIDGNGVAGFIVEKDPVIISTPVEYIPANIASGGVNWTHAWFENWPDYDYRDNFNANGSGTQYGWDWQFGGYGVKALWNPYLSHDPQVPNSDEASLYYGMYVDVYIVEVSAMTAGVYAGTANLTAASGTYVMTMPVQYACTNGAAQQTIWRAPMAKADGSSAAGQYVVVVDVNRDGKLSEGDIVDNLHKGESTPSDKVGFNVLD